MKLQLLEQQLGYAFNDRAILAQALTHPSYVHESGGAGKSDYQRLEFLGDSILGMLLAELLYQKYPDWDEGSLSRFRARLAGQDVLADRARTVRIGSFLYLGRGEGQSAGNEKDSILADVLEALLAAIYLDGGLPDARALVERLFEDLAASPGKLTLGRDSKSELQELLSAQGASAPEYRLLDESGPPHDRHFRYQVLSDGKAVGEGEGKSKKIAQQAAAAQALERIGMAFGQTG